MCNTNIFNTIICRWRWVCPKRWLVSQQQEALFTHKSNFSTWRERSLWWFDACSI